MSPRDVSIRCPAGNTDPEHYHVVKVFYREDRRLSFGSKSFTTAWRDWLLALRQALIEDLRQIDSGVLESLPDQPGPELPPAQLPTSLHFHIAMLLLYRIRTMEVGERLPSVNEITVEFGVSRTTIVRAIDTGAGLPRSWMLLTVS